MNVRPRHAYGDIIYHDQLQDAMKLLDNIQYITLHYILVPPKTKYVVTEAN